MCEDGFKLHSDKRRCIGEPVISFCCFCLFVSSFVGLFLDYCLFLAYDEKNMAN